MSYFTLKGSCLLTILIPMNFAIGDAIQFYKKKGINRCALHGIFLLCGLMGSIILFWNISEPYYAFIWGGGIIIAIIQNEFIFRKVEEEALGVIEKVSDITKIIGGVLLILMPYIPFFNNMLLVGMHRIVRVFCYVIYLVWGVEQIGIGLRNLIVKDKIS